MQILKKHFITIGLIGFIIFLLVRGCGGRSGETTERLKAENKRLQEQNKSDQETHARERARWADSIALAGINSELQVKVIQEVEKKLGASQSTIARLASQIRNANTKPDSSFVLVSPGYKQACDSLPPEIDKLNSVILELQTANTKLWDRMSHEMMVMDSALEVERNHVDRLDITIAAQQALISDAIKAARPRGRLLGGVGLIGNPETLLSGTKINLAYQTKNGKQYQVGGLILKGTAYYEATVLITLFK